MRLVPLFESSSETTTIRAVFGEYPDQDELIWSFIGEVDLDTPLPIHTEIGRAHV